MEQFHVLMCFQMSSVTLMSCGVAAGREADPEDSALCHQIKIK